MSADDAIFVQQNKEGKYTAQHGFMSSDELPDPEKTDPNFVFNTLDDLVTLSAKLAWDTEYGFRFFLPAMNGGD